MQFGTHTIEISKSEKLYFPEKGITKGELIDYYNQVADYLLPFIENRPLTIRRFPNGINNNGFYQKDRPAYFPEWIGSLDVPKKEGGILNQLVCNDRETLIYLVNLGCVELHSALSSQQDIQCPDRLVFDLDSPDGDFRKVEEGALITRDLLERDLGLQSFPLLTGSRGMHVVVPIRATLDFDLVRSFASKVATYLVHMNPDRFTANVHKERRENKLFPDYLRNSYGQAAVAPYSVRALPGAPVAMPLNWEEVGTTDLSPCSYTVTDVFQKLEKIGPAWKNYPSQGKKLDYRIEQIDVMLNGVM